MALDGLSATLKLTWDVMGTKALDVKDLVYPQKLIKSVQLAFGTSANQANDMWADDRSLVNSTAETLDLYGGLTNFAGDTINPTRLRAIYIENQSETLTLAVGGGANPVPLWFGTLGETERVRPLEILMRVNRYESAWPITQTTGDQLLLAASGSAGTLNYRIAMLFA